MYWLTWGLMLQAAEKAAQQGEGDGTDGEVMFDAETTKEKEDDGVGVPNIVVDCSDKTVPAYDKVLQTNRLPSMEEVLIQRKQVKRRIVTFITYTVLLTKLFLFFAGIGWARSWPQGTTNSITRHLCCGSFPSEEKSTPCQ